MPSWTGGVPRQMSEAILARRGGGIKIRKSTTPASVSSPSATRQMSCPKMSLHKTILNGRVKENRTTSVF